MGTTTFSGPIVSTAGFSTPAIAAITPLTAATGTTGNVIADVTGTFSQTVLNNNFKAIADKINAILAALD